MQPGAPEQDGPGRLELSGVPGRRQKLVDAAASEASDLMHPFIRDIMKHLYYRQPMISLG
jgi:hypothetical protein